jgi:hypothetical protein
MYPAESNLKDQCQENSMILTSAKNLALIILLAVTLGSLQTQAIICKELDPFDENNKKDLGDLVEKIELQQVSQSKNLSQLLRSNSSHFWNWAKTVRANSQSFAKSLIDFNGIIMGDSHLGNMHPTLDTRLKKLIWKNVDLDDAGTGSYAFDFLHFVLSVKVVSKEIHVSDMVDAYKDGLTSKEFKPKKTVQKLTAITAKEYEKMRQEYVERKTNNGKIKLKPDEIIAFNAETAGITRQHLQTIIKKQFGDKTETLDLAMIPKSRGGSAGLRRIWALLLIDGKQHIFEIKELGTSGLENYDIQDALTINFAKTRTYFDYTEKELGLVEFGGGSFVIREKKITLFDVPYKLESKEDEKFLEALGDWGAYLLGQWHSGQSNSQTYTTTIMNNQDGFLLFIKQLRKDYLKIVTGIYDDQN